MEQLSSFRRTPGGVVLIIVAVILFPLTLLLWLLLRLLWPRAAHNYLVPQQVNLVVEHSGDLSEEQIAQRVGKDEIFADDLLQDAFISPRRVYTFREGERAFSVVAVEAPRARAASDVIALVNRINRDRPAPEPTPEPSPDAERQDKRGWRAALGAARRRQSAPSDSRLGEVSPVRQATANWLSNAAGSYNGPGSPGARPVAVPPDMSGSVPTTFESVRYLLPEGLTLPQTHDKLAPEVHVYILDTVPCDTDWQQAHERWSKDKRPQNSPYPHNPTIEHLLGQGGPIVERVYAGAAHLLQQTDFFIPSHNYVMTDHGLFVAAIIHAIAPNARLHMVEVLNPYGVGSLESIVRGFALAASAVKSPDSRVIVNASLAMDVPYPDDPDWLKQAIKDDPFWKQFTPDQLRLSMEPFGRICALLRASKRPGGSQFPYVGVIAAAGNDHRRWLKKRPPARFPAAFDGVVGVGALDHDGAPAEYSNVSDTLSREALAAFGGTKDGDDAHREHGVTGPYIGAFPDGTPNISGWARWAGTSFAAPIVTGAIAALMSDPAIDFAIALQRVKGAYANPQQTELGETVALKERTV